MADNHREPFLEEVEEHSLEDAGELVLGEVEEHAKEDAEEDPSLEDEEEHPLEHPARKKEELSPWFWNSLEEINKDATVEEKAKLVEMLLDLRGIRSSSRDEEEEVLDAAGPPVTRDVSKSDVRSGVAKSDTMGCTGRGWEMDPQGVDPAEFVDEVEDDTVCRDAERPREVRFEGETFKIGDCFHHVVVHEGGIAGITHFVNEETAFCVPVVPYETTIVGIFQRDLVMPATPPPKGCNYMQIPCRCTLEICVCSKSSEIHLSNLLRRKTQGKLDISLPFMAYAPRVGRTFAVWDVAPKLIAKKRDGPLNSIDLFCGAGGASGGMKRAGFNVVAGVDNDFEALCAFYQNHGGRNPALHRFCLESVGREEADGHFYVEFFAKCKQDMVFLESYIRRGGSGAFLGTVNEFLSYWKNQHGFKEALKANGEIHLVHLSPPCQGFSAAKREPHPDDAERNALSHSIVDVGRIVRPLTMSFENVLGMWRQQFFGSFLSPIYVGLLGAGYQFRQFDLQACLFGDPQVRSRLFIVSARSGVQLPAVPGATHRRRNPNNGSRSHPGSLDVHTVRDAIGIFEEDFPVPNHHPAATHQPNRELIGDEKYHLVADQPAPAIRASKAPKHYRTGCSGPTKATPCRSIQPSVSTEVTGTGSDRPGTRCPSRWLQPFSGPSKGSYGGSMRRSPPMQWTATTRWVTIKKREAQFVHKLMYVSHHEVGDVNNCSTAGNTWDCR
jgi:site-specific DNA-cytosine methylase